MKTQRRRNRIVGQLVGVRLQPELLAKLDKFRGEEKDLPNRPEAIRRLVEKALKDLPE